MKESPPNRIAENTERIAELNFTVEALIVVVARMFHDKDGVPAPPSYVWEKINAAKAEMVEAVYVVSGLRELGEAMQEAALENEKRRIWQARLAARN